MISFYWYLVVFCSVFFFKQKTAYEMRISDWSSDVCSSDLITAFDTYWSRLMSGAVYTEGQVSGLVSGDVMVDAGGVVSVADGTAIPGSLYGNGSTTAASVVNFDKSATVGGDLIGSNTWLNFRMAADGTATIKGSVPPGHKYLASGAPAGP